MDEVASRQEQMGNVGRETEVLHKNREKRRRAKGCDRQRALDGLREAWTQGRKRL